MAASYNTYLVQSLPTTGIDTTGLYLLYEEDGSIIKSYKRNPANTAWWFMGQYIGTAGVNNIPGVNITLDIEEEDGEIWISGSSKKVDITSFVTGGTDHGKNGIKYLKGADIGLIAMPWKKPPYLNEEYEIAFNNGLNLANAIKEAHDEGYAGVIIERAEYPFTYNVQNPVTSLDQTLNSGTGGVACLIMDVQYFDINLNGSTFWALYDSDVRNPYDGSSNPTYMLGGRMFGFRNTNKVTIRNGELKGDCYVRSWSNPLERNNEGTSGIFNLINNLYITVQDLEIHGFRGDGIYGSTRGVALELNLGWELGGLDDNGLEIEKVGSVRSKLISLTPHPTDFLRRVYRNAFQIMTSGYTREAPFLDPVVKVVFYNTEGERIWQEYTYHALSVYIPTGATSMRLEVFNEYRDQEDLNYGTTWIVSGSSEFSRIVNCHIHSNMRGGIANFCSNTVIDSCKFSDFGRYINKYEWLSYTDATRYAINFEDVYVNGVTCVNSSFLNCEHPFLAMSRHLIFTNNTIDFSTFPGAFTQVMWADISHNKFYNCDLSIIYNESSYRVRNSIVSNNMFYNSMVKIESKHLNHTILHVNNQYVKSRVDLLGNDNIISKTNKYDELLAKNGAPVRMLGLKDFEDYVGLPHVLIDGSNHGTRTINISTANRKLNKGGCGEVLIPYNSTLNEWVTILGSPAIGDQMRVPAINFLCKEPMLSTNMGYNQLRVWGNNYTSVDGAPDVYNFDGTSFTNIQLVFTRSGGAYDYVDWIVKMNGVYSQDSVFIINKQWVNPRIDKWEIVNSHFDISNVDKLFSLQQAVTPGSIVQITMINCTFFSETPKSLNLLQSPGGDASILFLDCRFHNVTSTD